MWIVTSDATDPGIVVVALAVKDPVRLIAQIIRAALPGHQQGFFKTDVTGATEFLR